MQSTSPLKSLWSRLLLRGVQFHDRHQRLDALYLVENPWRMGDAAEESRFERTNDIIAREFGRPSRILEFGSGEGHQTQWLLKAGGSVHGREISRRAVARAEKRCPAATFSVGDISEPFGPDAAPPFDLVVGCEVLYYLSDPDAAVRRMSRLGTACLVTYFQRYAEDIDSRVAFPGDAERETIESEDLRWNAVWWKN